MAAPQAKPITDMVYVTEKEIACDGGRGALGHPRVYLNMGKENHIICPYCSRKFILHQPA